MRADNSHHLVSAAQRRSSSARQRADAALERLTHSSEATTVAAFVRSARVSRSWLYSQPDLLAQLRTTAQSTSGSAAPSTVRTAASDGSLLRRLEVAQQRIRELTHDNTELKEQLAVAYGQARQARRP